MFSIMDFNLNISIDVTFNPESQDEITSYTLSINTMFTIVH